ILKYNIEIIEAISTSKSKRIISSLKAKRNKMMKEYINILKRGKNAQTSKLLINYFSAMLYYNCQPTRRTKPANYSNTRSFS
ncbi:BlyB family putative holin accessory protein, partial [Borreliella garinii]|uniref:BlyB family putative holin accessory protein n=1 Tax=Borreliella garinii TaxID=29519 RepID=UPI002286CB40